MIIDPIAILFDLDGVIVNSEEIWFDSLNNALKYFNLSPINKKLFRKKYWGNDLTDTLKKLGLPYKAIDIVNKYYQNNINKVKIFPDVKDTLLKLYNYKIGLITNTPKKSSIILLKRFDILQYFDIILTSDDVKFGKPNSEIIEKACKLLNVKFNDVIIIGDTISDIKAGRSIGSTVIGLNIEADFTINSLSEIIKLLDI
jgi:HAD superfamily hydrolase (TIGR01549 family)